MATKSKEDSSLSRKRQKCEDANDSEDELLAQAAAQWASNKEETSTTQRQSDAEKKPSKPLSLHITQLSFDATEYHVRNAFVEQGCIVDSVRLVYDRDGTTRTFRGVAFVDVADEESYQKALKLDRSTLLKRRINVRPTKTPSQLANIVQRTKDLVAEKIRKEREQETPRPHEKKKKEGHDSKKKSKSSSEKSGVHKKSSSAKKHKSTGGKGEDSDRKLTKKERNRRAAIIMQRKRAKR